MKFIGLPQELETNLKKILVRRGDYSIWGKEHAKIVSDLKKYAKQFDITLNHEKLGSIRKVYMRDKYIRRFRILDSLIYKISIEYDKTDILVLSKKYDFPPLAMMRMILLDKGYSKDNVKKITKDPTLLDNRDKEQFIKAIENDYIGDFEQDKITESANNFEREIEAFFDKKHIPYRTQADLTRDQIQLINRAVITPDLYFPQGVMIGGKKLYWIDAKNYYGGNASYVYNGVSKQADKYNKMYGYGGFIFKHGFSNALSDRVNAMFIEW